MAVPQKRKSSSKRDQRRAQHDRFTPPNLSACPNCEAPRLSHHACPTCGYYGKRQVVDVDDE